MVWFGDLTGNNWGPQADFKTCSGGMSIGEWCSISRDVCCAVCPMPPITGPATTTVWVLGTFLNLILVLMLTQEAPYNLALQVVGTDGAFIGLFLRPWKAGGGLSSFHYFYVPMYVVSCVPLAIAASLTSVAAMTGAGGGDPVAHGLIFGSFHKAVTLADGTTSIGYLVKPKDKQEKVYAQKHKVYAHFGSDERGGGVKTTPPPRPWLKKVIPAIWAFHIPWWIGIFARTYFGDILFTQENCNEEFSLTSSWKMRMAAFSFTFVAIAIIFFIPLASSAFSKYSSLMTIARTLHITDFVWQRQTLCRCTIAGVLFSGWALGFVYIHITALQTFLLLGDDPFDFGQINWLVSSMLIFVVILRSLLDYREATIRKQDSLIKDAIRREKHHVPLQLEHRKKVEELKARHAKARSESYGRPDARKHDFARARLLPPKTLAGHSNLQSMHDEIQRTASSASADFKTAHNIIS